MFANYSPTLLNSAKNLSILKFILGHLVFKYSSLIPRIDPLLSEPLKAVVQLVAILAHLLHSLVGGQKSRSLDHQVMTRWASEGPNFISFTVAPSGC